MGNFSIISREEMLEKLKNGQTGKLASWLGPIVGIAAVVGLVKYLPMLLGVVAGTIALGIRIGILAIVAMILLNKNTWQFLDLTWRLFIRKLTGLIINMDPIFILEDAIRKMTEDMENFEKHYQKLNSYLQAQMTEKKKLENDFKTYSQKLKIIKERLAKTAVGSNEHLREQTSLEQCSRQVTDLGKMIMSTAENIMMLHKTIQAMDKIKIIAEGKLESNKWDLKTLKREYEQAKQQIAAMKGIKRILDGDAMRTLNAEEAYERVKLVVGESRALTSKFLDGSSTLITDYEVGNQINLESAQNFINLVEQGGFDALSQANQTTNAPKITMGTIHNVPELSQIVDAEILEEISDSKTTAHPGSKYFN